MAGLMITLLAGLAVAGGQNWNGWHSPHGCGCSWTTTSTTTATSTTTLGTSSTTTIMQPQIRQGGGGYGSGGIPCYTCAEAQMGGKATVPYFNPYTGTVWDYYPNGTSVNTWRQLR